MTQAMKADHEIIIELKDLAPAGMGAVPQIPPILRVGDTVSYSSPDGSFRVVFPDGSLFGEPGSKTITDSRVLTIVKEGRFNCRCFVSPADGIVIGWSEQNPASGGAHDVGN